MSATKNIILTNEEIQHKIRRIAYQIYETNSDESEIVIAGIAGGGFTFAKKIQAVLMGICDAKISLCEVHIDKKDPLNAITTSMDAVDYKNKAVVLVDDVLNSGTTLVYGVKHFLEVPLKRFKTAVLVNRNHKKYPIKADFKGISLSTSLHEHVEVEFSEKNDLAYLS
ncbi:phosphoribosyltransferase family protein [Sungkyunkwania multivorans]|uniref:Phosphoribosyltransferase family protein n=1 Tax=Sungkyunkwania multivorans TaxID=1173618 RepID=A0ABW3CVZ4_9FLAO